MKKIVFGIILSVFAASVFVGCTEDINESARYVMKDKTAVDYMRAHSDIYGMFLDLAYKVPISELSTTTVGQLLSARGHYTIFAPSNEAIQRYLDSLAAKSDFMTAPSFDAFTDSTRLDSVRQLIVKSCIIDAGDTGNPYELSDLPVQNGGEIGLECLNSRKLTVHYDNSNSDIYINRTCRINPVNQDILVTNGVIHQVDDVIFPSANTVGDYLLDIVQNQKEGYLVMATAIKACGLLDTMGKVRDEVYEKLYKAGNVPDYGSIKVPEHRLIGFTMFLETDSLWKSYGIEPRSSDMLEKLMQWIQDQHQYSDEDRFTTDEDYKNPDNLLNQWLTYHILPMRLAANKLVIHENEIGYNVRTPSKLGNPVMDYLTPMGKRRLLKIYESTESNGVYLNRFPKLDNSRKGTGHELYCEADKTGCLVMRDHPMAITSDIQNATIYPLDKPLAYTDEVRNNLQRERIRFDFMSLFPEVMTNDMRKKQLATYTYGDNSQFATLPVDQVYRYCEGMWLGEDSKFRYWNNYGGTSVIMYCDEVLLYGRGDITFWLPPVPRKGVYELRYGYYMKETRGITQFYLGTDPEKLYVVDIPINLAVDPNTQDTGWETDGTDQDYNAEVDKKMRNNGFMKSPLSVAGGGVISESGRGKINIMRRIIFRMTLDPNETYYFRMRDVLGLESKETQLDFFELCAKEVYDNPETPEDIW